MPQIIEPPTRTMPFPQLARLRWNVDRFESLGAMKLLPEKGYELIEGDIVEKMSIKHAHARIITLLFALFGRISGLPFVLSQFSLWIDEESLPEPDFAVLRTDSPTLTERGFVQASDVLLLIEVSDSTLPQDLTTKARLYARAGIPEYWVIDVSGRRLFIHCHSGEDGYSQVTEYASTEEAAPLFATDSAFPVASILP